MNNTGVTGRILLPNTDFEHAHVWPTYFHLRFLDHDRYTYIHYIHISREISIEHPSVGLASLVPIIIIMNKSQDLTVFHGRQKLTSAKN